MPLSTAMPYPLPLIGQSGFASRMTQAQKLRAVRFVAFFMPSQFWWVVYWAASRLAGP